MMQASAISSMRTHNDTLMKTVQGAHPLSVSHVLVRFSGLNSCSEASISTVQVFYAAAMCKGTVVI